MSPKLKYLERVWAAEVEGRLPFQPGRPSKMLTQLAEEGLIQPMTERMGSAPVCMVKGWQLTHAGRYLYCASCKNEPEPQHGSQPK